MRSSNSHLTSSGAAKFLGVSVDTVRAWARRGTVPSEEIATVGGRTIRFFSIKELERFKKARESGRGNKQPA